MQIELLGATHLSDHTKFWETEHRFETMEIPAHGFLRLVVFFWRGLSRILRGILRLSISGSQPLAIDVRHWRRIWRRADTHRACVSSCRAFCVYRLCPV